MITVGFSYVQKVQKVQFRHKKVQKSSDSMNVTEVFQTCFKKFRVHFYPLTNYDLNKRGLTTEYSRNNACERCNVSLRLSTYKDINFVYKKSTKKKYYFCLRCAKRHNVTIEDLDNYVTELLFNSLNKIKESI